MIHESVTNAVGKRIVGKQNIYPLLRDCAEDDREMVLVVDTEKRRLRGNPLTMVTKSTDEYVILAGEFEGTRAERASIKTLRVLALSVESILGCTRPGAIRTATEEFQENGNG